MKVDMHYYGVYVLARCAGLSPEASGKIAMASQYVDDSVETKIQVIREGSGLQTETTAHQTHSLGKNREPADQRWTWVPFHFLPGAVGEEISAKLVCIKDSQVAQTMIGHYLELPETEFHLELVGVMAHVYADTFSHHGFSGVGSRRNRVASSSIAITDSDPLLDDLLGSKLDEFFGQYGEQGGLIRNFRDVVSDAARILAGDVAQMASGALGHGAVATYPDYPYLKWTFTYEMPDVTGQGTVQRDNPRDFMDACRALHDVFGRLARSRTRLRSSDPIPFGQLAPVLEEIIGNKDSGEHLCKNWRQVVRENRLGFSEPNEQIPLYEDQKRRWDEQVDAFTQAPDASLYLNSGLYRFQQAASYHRNYVLRWLLPNRGMMVI